MRFMQRSLLGLFLLALTVGLLALAAGSFRATLQEKQARESHVRPAKERVFSVNVLRAEPVQATPVLKAYGEIRSRRTLDIRAPFSGTIIKLSPDFVDGGTVKKGQPLLELDPADAQFALDVAKTDKAEAGNELAEAKAALVLAEDELAAAQAQAELRQTALQRQRNLAQMGIGTETASETAALAQSAAEQLVLGKRAALAQVQTRINRAGTNLARLQIKLDEAARRLNETRVVAEFDGVLSGVKVVEGGLVSTNEMIGKLIDPAALEVSFRLSSQQFSRLVAANGGVAAGSVRVDQDLRDGSQKTRGAIVRVSAEVGAGQTGRLVFASLVGAEKTTLRPGDFVTVEISEPALENVVVLPATALDAAGNVLVVTDQDRLAELAVQVLRKQDDSVIVRGNGLLGRDVVEERSPLLGAGIKVRSLRRADRQDAAADMVQDADMISLSAERRARLVQFVTANSGMAEPEKNRLLARLKAEKVPAGIVQRLEKRIGG